jgi:very-short-patch-repair endonuclease
MTRKLSNNKNKDLSSSRLDEVIIAQSQQAMIDFRANCCDSINESKCESPIEQLMAAGFLFEQMSNSTDSTVDYRAEPYLQHKNILDRITPWFDSPGSFDHVYVFPQVLALDYRIDFMVYGLVATRLIGVAVECDGHDFHERTKEQAQRDKARDRALLSYGIPVMRFTGSEIFKNPQACALRAITYFSDATTAHYGEDHWSMTPTQDGDEPF